MIMGAEQVLNDIAMFLSNASTQEGLKQITEAKVQAHIVKANNKIDKECKVDSMTVQNTLKDGETVQDLGERGNKVVLGLESCKANRCVPSVCQSPAQCASLGILHTPYKYTGS